MIAPRRIRTWIAIGGSLSLLLVSCAYFNTLYNAKEDFKQAERATAKAQASQQQLAPGATSPNDKLYESVVDKCKKMIANYPKSKYVDDAMLLSARALYALRRYDEAVAAVDTLEAKYPKSNVLGDALFVKGKSLVAGKKYDDAVTTLKEYTDKYRGNHDNAEGLYLLCTSLMQLGMSDDAVTALHRLEKDHGRSSFKFQAQVEMADILAQKELYKESLAVYQQLSESRIPSTYRYDVWLGMARVQEALGDHAGALATLEKTSTLPKNQEKEPQVMMLRAQAHTAIDSVDAAVSEYQDITKRFPRTADAAEAYYRLGGLYEGMDSLDAAEKSYTEVPRTFSTSDFAEDAIKRSSDIGRVLKLQKMAGDNSPEAIAMRTFSMAEIQLFQFKNTQKAITNYEKIVNDFPDTEYAPRAVYALGYINGVVLGDSTKAREWYDVLQKKYPTSTQAELAFEFYKGAGVPSYADILRMGRKQQATAKADSTHGPPGPPPPGAAEPPHPVRTYRPAHPGPAAADSTRAPAHHGGAAAKSDSTAAPADTSKGGH